MTQTPLINFCGYDFQGPFTNMDRLADAPGVYVVCDWRSDATWHVLDVGESEHVKTRVESHERSSCWQRHQQRTLGFAVLYTSGWSASQRRALESRIRADYTPPCGER